MYFRAVGAKHGLWVLQLLRRLLFYVVHSACKWVFYKLTTRTAPWQSAVCPWRILLRSLLMMTSPIIRHRITRSCARTLSCNGRNWFTRGSTTEPASAMSSLIYLEPNFSVAWLKAYTSTGHLWLAVYGWDLVRPVFAVHSKLAVVIYALEPYPKFLNLALLSQLTVKSG